MAMGPSVEGEGPEIIPAPTHSGGSLTVLPSSRIMSAEPDVVLPTFQRTIVPKTFQVGSEQRLSGILKEPTVMSTEQGAPCRIMEPQAASATFAPVISLCPQNSCAVPKYLGEQMPRCGVQGMASLIASLRAQVSGLLRDIRSIHNTLGDGMRKNENVDGADNNIVNLEINLLCQELSAFDREVQHLRLDVLGRPTDGFVSHVVRSRSAPGDHVPDGLSQSIRVLDTFSASNTTNGPMESVSGSSSPTAPHRQHHNSNARSSPSKAAAASGKGSPERETRNPKCNLAVTGADQAPDCDWLLYSWKGATKRATGYQPTAGSRSSQRGPKDKHQRSSGGLSNFNSWPSSCASSLPNSPSTSRPPSIPAQESHEGSGQRSRMPGNSPRIVPDASRATIGSQGSAMSPRGRARSPPPDMGSSNAAASPSSSGRGRPGNAARKKTQLSPSNTSRAEANLCVQRAPQHTPSRIVLEAGVSRDSMDDVWMRLLQRYPSHMLVKEAPGAYKLDGKGFTCCMDQGRLRVQPSGQGPSFDAEAFICTSTAQWPLADPHKEPLASKVLGQSTCITDKPSSGGKAVISPRTAKTKPMHRRQSQTATWSPGSANWSPMRPSQALQHEVAASQSKSFRSPISTSSSSSILAGARY